MLQVQAGYHIAQAIFPNEANNSFIITDLCFWHANPDKASEPRRIAPLLNLQLRAIETTDWERRLAEVEST
jgi:hypothetical protein